MSSSHGTSAHLASALKCPACGFAAAAVDDACGSCGAPLAILSVVGGRVRLDEHSERVDVSVTNTGVVPASFVLRSSDARAFPPWLVGFPDLDVAVVVEPGALVQLRFLVDAGKLPLGAASSARAAGRAIVPLVTSVVRFDEERRRGMRRVLAIELATEGRPAPSPRAASYRFLPRELLEDGASLPRPLTVRNDGGHPVSLVGVSLAPRDVVVPRGAVQLTPEAVLALPAMPQALVIPPGGAVVVDARLRLLPGRLPEGALGVFAADVVFAVLASGNPRATSATDASHAHGREVEHTRASIDGVIGDGPRVRVAESLSVHTGGRPVSAVILIDNPGAVPVRVTGAEVLVPPDEPQDDVVDDVAHAWLRIVDDDIVAGGGFLLQPDESREVHVVIDPEKREGAALDRPWSRRIVRFQHDGVSRHASGHGHADIVIAAELGRTRTLDTAILGVDFGTSNSSTSLYFGPRAALQALAIDREAGRESLASTMFYVGSEAGRDFLFGQSADNAAPLAWTNLVKNLKSAVARDPSARWSFVDPKTGRLAETFGAQALLDRFIVEVKRRSEDGLRALPMPALAALGLVDTGVRFKHAVFSHPVGADEAYLASLWTAARACGLVEEPSHGGPKSARQFAEERCIDEALAAVIAFVHIAAGLPPADAIVDDERLLCFDIGGGTTDIAAVEVNGLRSFRDDPSGHVDVVLRASGGDPRFGGTDIDRMLAGFLLDEMAKRPELSSLDIDEVRRATFFTAYDAFRRARGDAAVTGPQRARAVFSRATDVLRAAERIKLALARPALTGAAAANDTSLFVPDLDDWPTRAASSAPTARTRVELRVTRGDLDRVLAQPLARVSALTAPVLADAGWQPDDVTTLLFTGQSSRLSAIRAAVRAVVESGRTSAARPLHVVEPGGMAGFDPKRCVAQGAAAWGDSKAGGGGWLRVTRRSRTALSSTLQSRRGPLLVEVPGLASGTALPARARLELSEPQKSVVLYRAGIVAWTFDLPVAAALVDIVIEGEERAHAIAGGVRAEGKRA